MPSAKKDSQRQADKVHHSQEGVSRNHFIMLNVWYGKYAPIGFTELNPDES